MTNIANCINTNLANQLFYAKRKLVPAEIKSMFTTPVLFDTIPQPASNQSIIIRNMNVDLNRNSITYTGGGSNGLYYGNTRTQAASNVGITAVTGSASGVSSTTGLTTVIPASNSMGQQIYISTDTQNFANGNSDVTFSAYYSIITFDASGIANKINNNTNSSSCNFAQLYIPSSSVQTLDVTPLTIVSSPGSGFMLIPDKIYFLLIFNSVTYSNATIQLIYGTSGSVALSSASNFISGTVSQHCQTNPSFSSFNPSNGDNNSLQIKASASPGASGNSALKIYLTYSTITL